MTFSKPLFLLLLVSSLTIVSNTSSAQASNTAIAADTQQNHQLHCDFNGVVFSAKYETGRLSACEMLSAHDAGQNADKTKDQTRHPRYLLSTHPENTPINPSPWYGFSVKSNAPQAHTIHIEMSAQNSRQRYLPKLSTDKKQWQDINFVVRNGNLAFELTVGGNMPLQYISAQEIIDNGFYAQWNKDIAKTSPFKLHTIGKSVQGRPIEALVHTEPDNTQWLLFIGRQHPPEITGALAFLRFIETLVAKNTANAELFKRFNILVVPLVNPDGVAAGNWRHNVNGTDLNRDWGKFTQPETRAVHDKLSKLMKNNHQLAFALDFHSTQQDIFYTMPTDYVPIKHTKLGIDSGVMPNLLVETWLEAIKQNTLRSFTLRDRPGTSPGRGVFKQFIADEYAVHAVTFEIGDNTNRALINHLAAQSAVTMVDLLLKTPAAEFSAK